ncbi:MAG: RHS repeat-associated core domain-containing protein [Anaerolineaceae bacterium]|nr:RHS repeat-associated core domain-containing protein [Anaerolineaceae bacterium]
MEVDGSDTTVRKTYSAGSTSLAVRTIVNGSTETLNWLLSDHLGSSSITTTADGTWNSEIRYSAFGETRYSSGITPTDYRYTGQLEQADVNLYYYNARYYDAALGRFIQADTIIPGAGNSKSYDRYAYVNNNPVIYTDPSGHNQDWGINDSVFNALFHERNYMAKISAAISQSKSQTQSTSSMPIPAQKSNDIIYSRDIITNTEEHGLCFRAGDNYNCSGGTNYNNWWKDEYIPLRKDLLDQNIKSIDAFGLRGEGTFWAPVGGIDINLDLVYFIRSHQLRLFFTPGGQAGAGGGADYTGGILIGKNIPDAGAYTGFSEIWGGDLSLGIGVESDVSVSIIPNSDGTCATTTYLGAGAIAGEGFYLERAGTVDLIELIFGE